MIKSIKINNFKGIREETYAFGQDTIITGKNGVGKSRIIEAIIYGFTGYINGYKKKIKDCVITIEMTDGRVILNIGGDVKSTGGFHIGDSNIFLSSVVPGYFNSLTAKDKMKLFLGFDTESTLPFGNNKISTYAEYKKQLDTFKSNGVLLDSIVEEYVSNIEKIKELSKIKLEDPITLRERYNKIMNYIESKIKNEAKLIEKTSLEEEISLLEESIKNFDFTQNPYDLKSSIEKRIISYDTKKALLDRTMMELESAKHGHCSTCGQELVNNELLESLKLKVKTLSDECKEIGISDLRKELKYILTQISSYDMAINSKNRIEYLKARMPVIDKIQIVEYTEEELEDLKLKLSSYDELFSKTQQKVLLEEANVKLKEKIDSMKSSVDRRYLDRFEEDERNRLISFENDFQNSEGIKIKLYKENKTTSGGQLIFEITKDDIEYFWLSTGQKLLVDTFISKQISNYYGFGYDFYLIDNGERLSEENYKKLLQSIGDKQIVFTRVGRGPLNIEID